ncbi:glucose-1-phosphate thymidylyltransferase [mine drainage metagenome]|uniref:UTP--glucose-1-phosphate uridylyltransferase n=1 Tax=mine drainage metagenome TaxID=410659 RepID=T0YUU3_9ZZZZ
MPTGFGDAVKIVKTFVDGDSFILNAGDGVILDKTVYYDIINEGSYKNINILTGFETDSPRNYGNAEITKEGDVIGVIEKPEYPRSNIALCATYVLESAIFDELELNSNTNELTPSINSMIGKGRKFRFKVIPRKKWISVGVAKKYITALSTSLEDINCQETSS